MAIEIAPTPVLQGKSAERFTRIMFENRNKKVGLTPVPNLKDITAGILEYQEKQRQKRGKK